MQAYVNLFFTKMKYDLAFMMHVIIIFSDIK